MRHLILFFYATYWPEKDLSLVETCSHVIYNNNEYFNYECFMLFFGTSFPISKAPNFSAKKCTRIYLN